MKTWESIWPQVVDTLNTPSSIKQKVGFISKLRGADTSWEAIKRARRRYGGRVATKVPPQLGGSSDELKLPTTKIKKPGKPTHRLVANPGDVWGYASDIHFGIEDRLSLAAMLRCWADVDVSVAVLGGDVFDCYALSKYDHVPFPKREVYNIEDEAKRAVWFWDALEPLRADTHLLPGNHEDRIYSLEKNNPGLVNSH
jgi:hypothetical protein